MSHSSHTSPASGFLYSQPVVISFAFIRYFHAAEENDSRNNNAEYF